MTASGAGAAAPPRRIDGRPEPARGGLLLGAALIFTAGVPLYNFSLFNVAGRGVLRLDWLAALAMLLLFALHLARRAARIEASSLNRFVAIYLAVGLLSGLNLLPAGGAQLVDFSTKAFQLVLVVLIFFVLSSLPLARRHFETVLTCWMLIAGGIAVYTLYQAVGLIYDWPFATVRLTNPSVSAGEMTGRALTGYTQATGVFKEAGNLAGYLLPSLALSSVAFLRGGLGWQVLGRRWVTGLASAAMLAAVVASGSLGGLATLTGTLGVVALWMAARGMGLRFLLRALAGLLLAAAGVWALFTVTDVELFGYLGGRVGWIWEQLSSFTVLEVSSSLTRRIRGLLDGLSVWLENPVLGVGLNNFAYHSPGVDTIGITWIGLLAERGIVGFATGVAVYGVALVLLYRTWQRLRSAAPALAPLALAFALVLVVDAISSLFVLTSVHPQRWFTLGLANLLLIRAGSWAAEEAPTEGRAAE